VILVSESINSEEIVVAGMFVEEHPKTRDALIQYTESSGYRTGNHSVLRAMIASYLLFLTALEFRSVHLYADPPRSEQVYIFNSPPDTRVVQTIDQLKQTYSKIAELIEIEMEPFTSKMPRFPIVPMFNRQKIANDPEEKTPKYRLRQKIDEVRELFIEVKDTCFEYILESDDLWLMSRFEDCMIACNERYPRTNHDLLLSEIQSDKYPFTTFEQAVQSTKLLKQFFV
jgi:hypothetical protein